MTETDLMRQEMAVLRNLATDLELMPEDLGLDPDLAYANRVLEQRDALVPILQRLVAKELIGESTWAGVTGDPREGRSLTDAGRDMLLVREVMES